MRLTLTSAALALVLCAPVAHAEVHTWFGFQVGLAGGPPPEVVWRAEPHLVAVQDVRVVDDPRCDEDVFVYGRSWWRMRDGWWWRGATWHGPWRAVDARRVPRPVLMVPAERWRHHPNGPRPWPVRRWDRDRGR